MDRIDSYKVEAEEKTSGFPLPGAMRLDTDGGKVMAVIYLCPCGCGTVIRLPVTDATAGESKQSNRWLYKAGPTIEPSVRHLSGCKSHYNITDGKVVWHADTGK